MKMTKKIVVFLISLTLLGNLGAQHLSEKANAFLNTLSPELKSQTLFPLNDAERFNMNFVPKIRSGTTLHHFNDKQKKAAIDLLKASVSKEGYRKTSEIMELEKVLIELENNEHKFPDGSPMRDPLNYHFWIFGNPAADGVWGWKFEGHHISLNFISTDNQIVSSTPSFFGSNPAIADVKRFNRKEVLKLESDLGFRLINSLDEDQLKVAIFSAKAPAEIITGNKRKAESLEQKGILYTALSDSQQKTFMELLNVYIDNYELGFAKTLRNKINDAGTANLTFAWAGSLKPGIGHYYRIQGPMLLIEYDNTQNNANHVHTVVRDLTNDFAEDILREHYEKEHK